MTRNLLLSIYVPTYNGSECIARTLDSIAPFLGSTAELIVSDDCSTDNTVDIIKEYTKKYPNIYLNRNEFNLGMDGNFLQAASLSNADYIWFCGQDDLIGGEAITVVTNVLTKHNLIALNCNFSQYNHDYSKCNFSSFFNIASFPKYKKIESTELLIFKSPQEYFSIFTQPPSFLPSVIMKRNLFLNGDPKKFYGTHFLQVGVFLENMHIGLVGALTLPLIKGRVPNNGWQKNGEKLINIMSGDIRAKKIAFDNNGKLPRKILNRDMLKFALNYPFLLANAYQCGLKRERLEGKRIEEIYCQKPFQKLLIKLTNKISSKALINITRSMKPIKRIILTFKLARGLKG